MRPRVYATTAPLNHTATTTQSQQQHQHQQHHYQRCHQHKMLPLVAQFALLLLCATHTHAVPISSPEIASKSGKATSGGSASTASLVIRPGAQDAQLNSLNVYATNYDNISPISSNGAAAQMQTIASFKPSYKLPDMETNFTPLQHQQQHAQLPLTASATPVFMQYLPSAALPDGSGGANGVQYLQLIPTRPFIVPFSPYLTANAAANAAQPAQSYQPPLTAAVNPGVADYAARAPAVLTPLPANSNNFLPPTLPHLVNVQGAAVGAGAASPYGLHAYGNAAAQPFRNSFRINREVKSKPFGGTLNLNLNEYVPSPNEPMRPMLYMRGRP